MVSSKVRLNSSFVKESSNIPDDNKSTVFLAILPRSEKGSARVLRFSLFSQTNESPFLFTKKLSRSSQFVNIIWAFAQPTVSFFQSRDFDTFLPALISCEEESTLNHCSKEPLARPLVITQRSNRNTYDPRNG